MEVVPKKMASQMKKLPTIVTTAAIAAIMQGGTILFFVWAKVIAHRGSDDQWGKKGRERKLI